VREILISARAISLHGKALVLQVWHDITERKQAEMALRESEERFRLLYEQAPLSYQALDERGHLIEVNQAWLDTLGYTREEVIGRWFGDFLTPESRVYLGEEFARFRTAGQTHARRWQGDSKHTDSNIRRQAVGRV
jgi:PAS domain S-box-containing protein